MIADILHPQAVLPGPTDDYWYREMPFLPGVGSTEVTYDTAMTVTVVSACLRVRAETLAQIPLHLMRTDGTTQGKALDHPLYRVLHDAPNGWQTSYEFREQMQRAIDTRGNAYALKVPGPRGPVDQLIPLNPDRMQVFRLIDISVMLPEAGRLGYLYHTKQGEPFRFTQDEILHVRGPSIDGVLGMSPIMVHRRAIQWSQQLQDHGVRWLTNAGKPVGGLKFPQGVKLGPDQIKGLRESWQAANTSGELYKLAIFDDGAEFQPMAINNEEMEFVQSMNLTDRHIMAIYRVPPPFVQDWERAIFRNMEQANIHLVQHMLLPMAVSWEQAIWRDLIVDQENMFVRFAVDGLLRGDAESRGKLYEVLWRMGALNADEIRALENLNPIVGGSGEIYWVPTNMAPANVWANNAPQLATNGDDVDAVDGEPGAAKLLLECVKRQTTGPAGPFSPGRELAKTREDLLSGWAADIGQRVASAEIAELSKRAPKAAEDSRRFTEWASSFWAPSGKMSSYAARATTSFTEDAGRLGASVKTAKEMAEGVCVSALDCLKGGDPVQVLDDWKQNRARDIAQIILGGSKDE